VQGQAVVGNQMQVDGQGLTLATQAAGQVALQGAVEAALEFLNRGQGGQQGIMDGSVRGSVTKGGAGRRQGGNAAGGVAEDGPEPAGSTLGAVISQAEMGLAKGLRVGADGSRGQGIMAVAHGSLQS
jgi:hypothetical protein